MARYWNFRAIRVCPNLGPTIVLHNIYTLQALAFVSYPKRRSGLMGTWVKTLVTLFMAFCLTALASKAAAQPSTIGLPLFDDIDLSSDGQHLLMVRAENDAYALVVKNLGTEEERILFQGGPDTGLINWCRWANASRILCSVRFYTPSPRLGYVASTRMFAVNADGSESTQLIRRVRHKVGSEVTWDAQVQDRVISWLTHDPENILIQLNRDHPNRPSVFKLNIYDNQMTRVRRPRESVRRWYASHEGTIRLAVGYTHSEKPYLYRVTERRLIPFKQPAFQGEFPPQPVGFTSDGKEAFVSMTNQKDRHGIYRVDLEEGHVVDEVFTDEAYDVFGGLIQHPTSGEPVGVRYTGHHSKIHWFDPAMAQAYTNLGAQLPGKHTRLLASDKGNQRLLVYNYGGVSPTYYIYDRSNPESVSLDVIGKDFPELDDEDVVDLEPVRYTSRDGIEIPAYMALPKGKQAPYPTILLPHGGPYARDSAEFDPWTQFFTDLGYAVLKPNYRGSVGYGEAYMQAGYKQWGLKMQEDLIDGLTWMLNRELADPNRVCMVGASYGGYSALVSAFKFHDQVKCAVSMAGISDLQAMVQRIGFFDLKKRNRERIQPGRQLVANSPIRQAEEIQSPVLLLHAVQDTVVRVRQSRRMAKELERLGKPYRYVEQERGDHFLSYTSQREQLFNEMEEFLAEHLTP